MEDLYICTHVTEDCDKCSHRKPHKKIYIAMTGYKKRKTCTKWQYCEVADKNTRCIRHKENKDV